MSCKSFNLALLMIFAFFNITIAPIFYLFPRPFAFLFELNPHESESPTTSLCPDPVTSSSFVSAMTSEVGLGMFKVDSWALKFVFSGFSLRKRSAMSS